MAEILVRMQDAPVPDSPGKHRRGMVAAVCPDGWAWMEKERPPTFMIIKVPGIPPEDLEYLIDEEYSSDQVDEEHGPTMLCRRYSSLRASLLSDIHGLGRSVTLPSVANARAFEALYVERTPGRPA